MAPLPSGAGASLGDLYSKCVQMVNENKISTKNAWELPLIEHMDSIVDSFMGGHKAKSGGSGAGSFGNKTRVSMGGTRTEEEEENRFHEASCTIEASARIYACRVDCVHTDTYRVLGGLNSADMHDDDGADGADAGGARKKRRICGVNTLEKNEASIIQQTLEADEQSDPTFRRMAAAFDAGGAKGLLLSHLPIAEDMSLVFNGDVPLIQAQGESKSMFEESNSFPTDGLGLGDPKAAYARIAEAKICPGVDTFRQELVGRQSQQVALPDRIEAIFGALKASTDGLLPLPAMGGGAAFGGDFGAPFLEDDAMDGLGAPFGDEPIPGDGFPDDISAAGASPSRAAAPEPAGAHRHGNLALPLADTEHAIVAVRPTLKGDEDVIAFDELFQKFCGSGGSSHQFAYFDECWSKAPKEGKGKDASADIQKDGSAGAEGALVPVDNAKEKAPKRPLFDIAGLGAAPKPIETEPVAKHQLSERAAQWQLHKDVPPYMIDRITMPSWPTWSKCDFACLGLRPHLMLKLVRKPMPETDGPHSFSDLFSTVVVENPEAYPWLATEARAAAAAWRNENEEDAGRAEREMEFGDDAADDDDFAGNGGLPAHLDIDPQDLFLRPGEKVLAGGGSDGEDGVPDFDDMGGDMGMGGDDMAPYAPDFDLDLVDRPATVGDTDIGYSRNSKFVDIKLVKKHLLDCITEDIDDAKEVGKKQTDSSFQDLVDRTVRRMPKSETANMSVAVCFICALHLCNEKSLELQVDPNRPLGDFAVVGSS
mmetsp:Transcript_33772/g.96907  ORF Transcript_33772/g.96907 Transcript_33772/m.96907 type:complete len:765 (+) Transcript_33772:63-2357(+)